MGLVCIGDRNAPAASATATSMQAASSGSMESGFIGQGALPGKSKFDLVPACFYIFISFLYLPFFSAVLLLC